MRPEINEELLAYLYRQKRLDRVQFAVGGIWQWNLENTILQPSRSYEFSVPLRFQMIYQRTGDTNESQDKAMERRRRWRVLLGPNRTECLDYLLASEMSKAAINERHGKTGSTRLIRILSECLTAFSIGLGARTPDPATYKLGKKWPTGEDAELLGWIDGHRGYSRDMPEREEARLTLRERQPWLFEPVSRGRKMKPHWFNNPDSPFVKYADLNREREAASK